MIKALIVDDEQHCIDRLNYLTSKHPEVLEVVATCNTVENALTLIEEVNPDLVFLDIQINGKTGFDFLEALNSVNFNIIFTTAYEQFAIKAFKYSAFDYLLKPIDEDDFTHVLNRLKKGLSNKSLESQMQTLLYNLKANDTSKKITIPTLEGFLVIETNNILYCEADTSYTFIHINDKKIHVSRPLKYYEELLPEDNFFRVHNSFLININHIKSYNKSGFITMDNDSIINVSTRKKEAFLRLIKKRMSH
ncbi:LytTR family DNA-binding domain-containing protein [Mangrovimonas sp. DI 80]|uniref:LytR/AlgR family response regulator transcription factor n=1 Tax=Mangrovimonas sp. DI 80 TaxID=1779330 RepID=UPI000977DCDE|nr:LytTR family DNA-binding domain-containing protein [Mangrovimonas sp. DI 80]OMP32479.1 hypothetical protein BKM32_05395 [Mangrovimonas sp. DI 80]